MINPDIIIPPRCDAWARKIKPRVYVKQRSDHVLYREKQWKMNWHKSTDYGERSLVEVEFYRYKNILGRHMYSINFENQKFEVQLASKALNIMIGLGMPTTEKLT